MVARAAPFTVTDEPAMKLDPVTATVETAPLVLTGRLPGVSVIAPGSGLVIAIVAVPLLPPPGVGFAADTLSVVAVD